MIDPMGKREKKVIIHIDILSRNSNVIHLIAYNWGNEIATYLVCPEDGV